MTKSITSKLIVLLTVSCAVILSVVMVIDYRISREEIMGRLTLESSETIRGVVTDLENWLDGVEGTTLFLGRMLEEHEYTLSELKHMLREVVDKNDNIYGATIALNPEQVEEAEGFAPYYYRTNNVLTYADLAKGEDHYWRRNWYSDAAAAGKAIWIKPYFDEDGAKVLMTTFSVPIYRNDKNGQKNLYGVVTADVPLDELHQYMQRMRLGKSGSGFLLSRKGIVLSARDPETIMQHYLETAAGTLDAATWQKLVQGALQGQLMTHQSQCQGSSGQCTIRLSVLQSTGWPVGFIYAEDEFLAPLRAYEIKIVILGLTTLIVMAVMVTFIARRLTRPLTSLAQVTDQIAQGKFDVPLPRVQGEDEVARLIKAFAAMKQNLRVYVQDLENATAARSRLEGELAAAREIQMAMLPQGGEALECSQHYSLWATVRPAKTVGGDLYTYYSDSSEHLFIAVGDVSDKGVPAALFMAKTISHIQQYSDAFVEPANGMALLNNALESGNSNCMFVTLFFGVLDLKSGELRFASAGHTPPSLLRGGDSQPLAQESGPALGLAPDLEFPENRVQLCGGDRLAIYTDGIDEAFNQHNKMFGFERLNRMLEQTRDDTTADSGIKIIQAIDDFAGSKPQSDDISLMLLDLPAGNAAQEIAAVDQSFATGPLLVSRVRSWLLGELESISGDEVLIMELTLVSEEIITNMEKYAGLSTQSRVEVSLRQANSEIQLEFSDPGIAFNPLTEARVATLGTDIESAEIGGLGIHLITELTDSQNYCRVQDRNILRVTRALS